MKRTLFAAVLGGAMALISSVITAEAAPVAAVQVGTTVQSGEPVVQKAGWRHRHYRHHHYRHYHYRPYYHSYAPRRHYYRHYSHRPSYWRHQGYYGNHTYRAHRRHYY